MKATGIVRRIDDLGRIVVPKEIRKVLRIREGDPLEIFTGKEGEIVLKKYSPMADLTAFAQQYVEAISQSLGLPVAITDRDSVIAVAGMPKRELMGKELHSELESVINDRKAIVARKGDAKFIHITTDDLDYDGQVVQTIISEGDAVGSVIVIVRDSGHRIGEIEQKAAVIAAAFGQTDGRVAGNARIWPKVSKIRGSASKSLIFLDKYNHFRYNYTC